MSDEEALELRKYPCPLCDAEPGQNCTYVFFRTGWTPTEPFAHSERGKNQ